MSRKVATESRSKIWLGRGIAVVLLVFTFGYVPRYLYVNSGFARTLELRNDLLRLRAQNERMGVENEKLERQVESLRSDLRAVERVARLELGWVRPGEVLFDLSERAP